ncbi:hypothetical protein GGI19_003143 [Coemansia pectinata]|uniref:Nodulin-like domain-containing protein n=1 Tax=Coemansia pectinata TaxID=1052879 RepID=A0A9W8LB94_9FUNG|nr:hypothetical protein GGI19_003143 [Coemansia pectinata]
MEPRESYTSTLSYIAICLSMLCGGTTSLFATYGSSFSEVLGFTQYETNLVASLGDYAHYMSAPLFGYLSTRIGPTRVIQSAAVLMFCGYMGLSYSFKHFDTAYEHAHHYVATMSMLFALVGVGSKAAYMSSMATTARNFKHSRHSGIALGIPNSLYGLSTFVFSSLKARWFESDQTPWRYLAFMAVVSLAAHLLASKYVVLKETQAVPRKRATSLAIKTNATLSPAAVATSGSIMSPSHESFEMAETRKRRMTVSVANEAGHADNDVTANLMVPVSPADSAAAENHFPSNPHSAGADTPPLSSSPITPLSATTAVANPAQLPEESALVRLGRDPIAWALLLGIICFSGPGLAFVNNCGSMVRAMSHSTTLTEEQIGQYKDKIVATQSFFSFFSRLVVGYLSDLWRTKLRLPRSGLLVIAGLLMIHAQNTAARVSRLEDMYPLAVLIGTAMGSAFTLAPTITAETWGAENFGLCWGIITLGPAIGGHICNLIFGSSWDQGLYNIISRLGKDAPQDRMQCTNECFIPAFRTTAKIAYFSVFFFTVVLCLPRATAFWKRRWQK